MFITVTYVSPRQRYTVLSVTIHVYIYTCTGWSYIYTLINEIWRMANCYTGFGSLNLEGIALTQ